MDWGLGESVMAIPAMANCFRRMHFTAVTVGEKKKKGRKPPPLPPHEQGKEKKKGGWHMRSTHALLEGLFC